MLNIRKRQRDAVVAILSAGDGAAYSEEEEEYHSESSSQAQGLSGGGIVVEWKVLILDETCRDVLAPLLSVNELRRLGVTSHLALEAASREPLEEATAVYLCRPTEANAARVAKDCGANLYGRARLNFSSRVERRVLERLAREVAAELPENVPVPIASVWDRSVEFAALEPRLFALAGVQKNSSSEAAASSSSDAQDSSSSSEDSSAASVYAERVATGLCCACATLFGDQHAPVLRCRAGGAAERVAEAARLKLRDAAARGHKQWSSSSSSSQGGGDPRAAASVVGAGATGPSSSSAGGARPVVILLDRGDDLATPLKHTETYQALVDDVLASGRNRVTLNQSSSGSGGETHELSVDGDDDFFASHARRSLPDVIDASADDLAKLRERERKVRGAGAGSAPTSSAGALADAVGELPALLERKKRLEAHTSILGAVMEQVMRREIPSYYEAEEARRADKTKLRELLGPDAKGSLLDKLRLLFARALGEETADDLSDDDLDQLARLVVAQSTQGVPEEESRVARRALLALERLRKNKSRSSSSFGGGPGQAGHTSAADGNAEASVTAQESSGAAFARRMLSRAHAGAAQIVDKAAKGVGDLVLGAKATYAARVADHLMSDAASSLPTDDLGFRLLDPLGNDAAFAGGARRGSDAGVVFVVGGGCYAEYHAVQAAVAARAVPGRTVVYGATELLAPEAFLHRLIDDAVGFDDDHLGGGAANAGGNGTPAS